MATSDIKQHKDLIGIDLHIARLNAGTTSPVGVVTPSIIDEAYANKTTKELFIATGLTSNDWIKLSSDAAANLTGTGTPVGSKTPTTAGQLYGDLTTGDLYLSTGTTANSWILKPSGGTIDETNESLKIDGTVIGNGTADDTTAIKNRLTAAISSKKVLRAPTGTYKFSGRITPSGVRLIGSPGAKLVSTQGGNAQDITMAGSGSVLADFEIQNPTSTGQVINAAAGATNYTLRDLKLTTVGNAIQINAAGQENMLIQNVDVNTVQYGLLTNESAKGKNLRVLFSNFYSRDSDALELNNPQAVSPELYDGLKQVFLMGNRLNADLYNGNTAVRSGFGIGVAKVHEVIGIGNIVERARARGLHIEDSQENVLFLGNIFDGNLIDGIWLLNQVGARPVIVTNNFVIKAKDAVQQTGNGIWRVNDLRGSLQANVSHNYVKGFQNGMWIDGSSAAHIDGCTIEDCAVGIKTGAKLTGTVTMKNVSTLTQMGNGASIEKIKSQTPPTTIVDYIGTINNGTTIGGSGCILKGLESLTNSTATSANVATPINLFKLPTRFDAKVTIKIENVANKYFFASADVNWNGTTLTQSNVLKSALGEFDLASENVAFINNNGSLALNLYTTAAFSNIVVQYEFTNGVYFLNTVLGTESAPSIPTNLVITSSSTQAALTWSAAGGATKYNVKRSTTSGGSYTTIASPTSPSYIDTGLTDGTVYYYVVSAENSSGESNNSAQATATPVAPTGLPSVPSGVAAIALDQSISLSWTPSTNGPLTYTIKRSTVSGSGYVNIVTGQTATSYTDSGLTNGTAYYYVVSATNANGETANSTQVSGTPAAEVVIFSDNFNRVDNATDPGYSLGWTANTSNWGIVGNTLKQVTHTAVNDYLTYKSTVSDCVVTTTFLHPTNNQRLIFRRLDSANEWFIDIQSNNYLLRKRVGNTVTTAVDLLTTPASGDKVSARLNGSSIRVFINNVEKTSSTFTDSALQTQKEHGVSAGSTNAVGEWDDFKITGL